MWWYKLVVGLGWGGYLQEVYFRGYSQSTSLLCNKKPPIKYPYQSINNWLINRQPINQVLISENKPTLHLQQQRNKKLWHTITGTQQPTKEMFRDLSVFRNTKINLNVNLSTPPNMVSSLGNFVRAARYSFMCTSTWLHHNPFTAAFTFTHLYNYMSTHLHIWIETRKCFL